MNLIETLSLLQKTLYRKEPHTQIAGKNNAHLYQHIWQASYTDFLAWKRIPTYYTDLPATWESKLVNLRWFHYNIKCYTVTNPKEPYLVSVCRFDKPVTASDGTTRTYILLYPEWKWTVISCEWFQWPTSTEGSRRNAPWPGGSQKTHSERANIAGAVWRFERSHWQVRDRWWQKPFHAPRSRETRRVSVFFDGSRSPPVFTPSVLAEVVSVLLVLPLGELLLQVRWRQTFTFGWYFEQRQIR